MYGATRNHVRVMQVECGRLGADPGIRVKLCRGGGQLVAHSSELPKPHGSSSVTLSPCREVMYTFHRKINVDAPG